MRKILLTLTAVAGLAGAGVASQATAKTIGLENIPAASLVQPVQYYGGYRGYGWHHRYWRHRRWEERHWHRHWGYRRW